MTPQMAYDPYVLQQASCRASLLVSRSGFPRDEWEDLRQEMVLDCLERSPRFDPDRGDWRGFVRGVVRNHSCLLARRESQRIRFETLDLGCEEPDAENLPSSCDVATDDPTPSLALSADVQRVVAALPDHLQTLASELSEMTVAEIAAKRGRSTQWIYQLLKRLRRAFVQAGVTPESMRRRGGNQ
jgi:RNA polymerase sigma-70 factor, ECF subfamily